MSRSKQVITGIFLLALIFTVGIVSAADIANLSVSKSVNPNQHFETGRPVTWIVTVSNNGPANATNISLAENTTGFSGQVEMSGVADRGTYNNALRTWNISHLDNATSAHLTIVTVFHSSGQQTNNVNILGLDQTNHGNTHASAIVVINNAGAVIPDQPLNVKKGNLTIRPNTLNLNSKGIFTVFVTLNGGDSLFPVDMNSMPRINITDSTLSCGGADMISAVVSNKDGGTLIAKFHRQDLENVTRGAGVQINCSGTLSVNGKPINVEGSDTIRVIGEKKGLDKFISGLMRYLGLEKDEIAVNETDNGNVTVSFTLNPDDFRNNGQMKKALKSQDSTPSHANNVRNLSDTQQDTVKNNGKDKNNNGKGNKIQENIDSNNGSRGKQNSNRDNDASNGKSNGKKDK